MVLRFKALFAMVSEQSRTMVFVEYFTYLIIIKFRCDALSLSKSVNIIKFALSNAIWPKIPNYWHRQNCWDWQNNWQKSRRKIFWFNSTNGKKNGLTFWKKEPKINEQERVIIRTSECEVRGWIRREMRPIYGHFTIIRKRSCQTPTTHWRQLLPI